MIEYTEKFKPKLQIVVFGMQAGDTQLQFTFGLN